MPADDVVLITGGAGFIGSHLATSLVAEGSHVRVLDRFDKQVHGEHRSPHHIDEVEVVTGDVTDEDSLEKALTDVSRVVHLAAAVGVGQSMYEVDRYCHVNVMGTARLLQALIERKGEIEKLVVASSMSIYGEGIYYCETCSQTHTVVTTTMGELGVGKWDPSCPGCHNLLTPIATPESKTLQPTSVYAINKRDQEELCLVVGRAHDIPTIALRLFNVYGPGQTLGNPYTGVAAIFASRLVKRRPPLIFEDGNQSRDFVHVRDVAGACVMALENDSVSDVALNVGTGKRTTILEVADALSAELGGPTPELLGKRRKGDVRHCFADISAARKQLGWEPRLDFETGVRDLIDWTGEQLFVTDRVDAAVHELAWRGLVSSSS